MAILVLEDVPLVRERIVTLLTDIVGVEQVLQAGNAPSALDLFSAHHPGIVILDISVPGNHELRNGIDVLKRIRKVDTASTIVMLTNFATPQYRHECERAGADYFLDKSREFDQLPAIIEGVLARSD